MADSLRAEAQIDLERKVAGYAMALDLTGSLAEATTEDESIDRIVALFTGLFSPARLVYLPLLDGVPGPVRSHPDVPADLEATRNRLVSLETDYAWTEPDDGFVVRFSHRGTCVGVLQLESVAFPEHKQHYLNLALSVSGICGLAVANARTFERVRAAEEQRVSRALLLLEQSEEQVRFLVEQATDAVICADSGGTVVLWNRAAERMFGYAASEMVGQPAVTIIPERLRQDYLNAMAGVSWPPVSELSGKTMEVAWLRKDGSEFPGELSLASWKVHGEVFYGVMIRDITARKRDADVLRESERRVRDLMENVHLIAATIDRDGDITFCNDFLLQLTGWQREEVLGKNWFEVMAPPDDREGLKQSFTQRMREPAESSHHIADVITRWGERRTVSWNNVALRDLAGHVVGEASIAEDITEHRRVERALRESEERYRRLVELSPNGIAVHSEGKIVFANAAAARIMRAESPQQLIGLPIASIVHPAYRDVVGERVRASQQSGREASLAEEKFIRLDGIEVDVEVVAIPFVYEGKPATQVVVQDIAERKLAQQALSESEQKFRSVVEQSLDGIVLVNDRGIIVEWNRGQERITGVKRSDVLGRFAWDVHFELAPHDLQGEDRYVHTKRAIEGLLKASPEDVPKLSQLRERPVRRPDGTRRTIQEVASLIGTSAGVMACIVARDVTEAKEAQDALRKYELLSEHARDAILFVRQDGMILEANSSAMAAYGYTREELVSMSIYDLLDPPAASAASEHLAAARLGGHVFETFHRRKDGSVIAVEVSGQGTVIGDEHVVLEIIRDISDRRRSEQALRESEVKYRTVFLLASDAIITVLPAPGGILEANDAAVQMLGYTRDELRLLGGKDIIAPEIYGETTRVWTAQIEASGHFLVETLWVRKDGSRFPVEVSGRPYLLGGRAVFQLIGRDITERKRLQEQLLQAHRMEMAGRLAGQVAHDFNNLLSPMTTYPELIKMELPQGHPGVELCDSMLNAAHQMADINQDLLTLSRRGHFNQTPTDVNRLVKEAAAQLPSRPASLSVEIDLARHVMPVNASPAQLMRVVFNLLSNAREAMQDSGVLKIKTDRVYVDQPFGRHRTVPVGEFTRISVSDTGSGIPEDVQERIFDPFFTTKLADRRRGSGLGLSVVQAIIEDHHGHVYVESQVGKGTTFSIYLPICHEVVKEEIGELTLGGTETILIVDDDDVQREVSTRALVALGYQVSAVSSGEDAISYLSENPVHLLVLDMVMPGGLDGTETFRQVLRARPGQRAIILSGFSESHRVREAQSLGAGAYLRKPVTLVKLARAIRKELDRA